MASPQPTPPNQCGLALALPTDRAAVERGLAGGPFADYVGRGALWGSAAELWANSFKTVAAAADELAQEATLLGVRVRKNATLSDLNSLFGECRVITTVAHWRGPQISKHDIAVDPLTIIRRITEDPSELAGRLRASLPLNWRERLDAPGPDSVRCSRLAELLDTRMQQRPALDAPPAGMEWHMDEITLRHHNRAALDGWWPEAFKPGNRLELADGLHASSTISDIVPEQWTGVADFSNCRSAQLMDLIKQNRCDRTVIANEYEANPMRRLALLKVIYGLLSRGNTNYADVRIAMAERMRREASATKGAHP